MRPEIPKRIPPHPFGRHAPKNQPRMEIARAYMFRLGFFDLYRKAALQKIAEIQALRRGTGTQQLSGQEIEKLAIQEHGMQIRSLRWELKSAKELMGLKTFLRDWQAATGGEPKKTAGLTKQMSRQTEIIRAIKAELVETRDRPFRKRWAKIRLEIEGLKRMLKVASPQEKSQLRQKLNELTAEYEKINRHLAKRGIEK